MNARIPAGEDRITLEIAIIGDTEIEEDETFIIKISGLDNAQISESSVSATILNDDERDLDAPLGDEGYVTPTTYPGYTLVWQDEFNDGQLSADWTYEIGDGCPNLCGWGNQELQSYTNRPENIYFQEGS